MTHSFPRPLIFSSLSLTDMRMGPRSWVPPSGRAYDPKRQHTVYLQVLSENAERHQNPTILRGRCRDLHNSDKIVESKDPRGWRGMLVSTACAQRWNQLLYSLRDLDTLAWTRCLKVQESYGSEVDFSSKINVLAKGLQHDNVDR